MEQILLSVLKGSNYVSTLYDILAIHGGAQLRKLDCTPIQRRAAKDIAGKLSGSATRGTLGTMVKLITFGSLVGAATDVMADPTVCRDSEYSYPAWMGDGKACYELAVQAAAIKWQIFEAECRIKRIDGYVQTGQLCKQTADVTRSRHQKTADDLKLVLGDVQSDLTRCINLPREDDPRLKDFMDAVKDLATIDFSEADCAMGFKPLNFGSSSPTCSHGSFDTCDARNGGPCAFSIRIDESQPAFQTGASPEIQADPLGR